MDTFLLFASIEMSENDKRALIALIIILVILFVLIGLLGMAVRKTMQYQARYADTMMHDVTVTHVVTTPSQFRILGRKKNHRRLYRQSLIPFAIMATGVLVWVIYCLATSTWTNNIFAEFGDLFFVWDWADSKNWVAVFNLTLLGRWPDLIHAPFIEVTHIASYFEVLFILVGGVWYLVVVQAFISRALQLQKRSRDVFSKSLEGYKANDIDTSKVPPLPPSD
ncbi:MAG: hypothetical protein BWY98_00037 [Tenericutes bacterium ADurb.BinA155]|jgi:hypothetical protein|nr:MAG: hypothetical protein BWY98_00037 [Tenericutes bacterium ADurb.BinA155]